MATGLDWDSFILDDQLRRLIATGLQQNRDLRKVLLDVDAARSTYRIERSTLLPQITAQGQGSRQRVPADLSTSGRSAIESQYQAGAALGSFELDLFGRVRSQSQAALQEYLATEAAATAARNLLIDNISRAYLSHHAAGYKMEVVSEVLESRQQALALLKMRVDQGVSTDLDLQEADGLAAQAEVELQAAIRQYDQSRNALHLLVGTAELALDRAPYGFSHTFAEIQPGLPSEMLLRRPDIIAAEHRLRARNADIGAARAAFLPSISLTGVFGSASSQLSGLFETGSKAWTFAPAINVPLFSGGRNRANLDLAHVRKDQAVATYESTIQTAFFEVADAIVAADTLRQQEQSQQRLAESSEAAARLADQRYLAGVDGQLVHLDAERRSLTDKLTLIDVHLQANLARSTLFRALGGGAASRQLRSPSATNVVSP